MEKFRVEQQSVLRCDAVRVSGGKFIAMKMKKSVTRLLLGEGEGRKGGRAELPASYFSPYILAM